MQFNKHPLVLAAFAAGVLTVSACGAQETPKAPAPAKPAAAQQPLQLGGSGGGEVAATVNGVPISKAKVDFAVKQRTAAGQPDTPEMRNAVKEDLINRELISQEAKKKGVDKQPEVVQQVELAQQQVLVGAYLQDWVKNNPPSDDELKKDYEKIKGQMGDTEYKARHILVASEDEAKKIIAELKKDPKKFPKLAEKSKDTGSAKKGGELDWAMPNAYVKPFSDALTGLKKGEMTQTPVQTQFGWHVIKLDDTRPAKFPSYEEVKPQIAQQAQQQQVQKLVTDLRSKAKVE
ncbi:MAG TPA: peptidylprolyl isomerase [Burkholderiales bacterium]|nr:peptidylprolyl isomerase [Burkholderiales bacterium]